jgi:hypothetical protein
LLPTGRKKEAKGENQHTLLLDENLYLEDDFCASEKVLSKYLKKWIKCHKANYLTDYQAERLCSLLVYNAIQMS